VFRKSDYQHGDGMLTKVWGPSLWHSLHTISFNYPIQPTTEHKKHYRNFILSLQNVLPCKHCRLNLKQNFRKLPLTLSCMASRDSFSRYIYDLHELINKMLGKVSGLTYCDVRERYEHFRARCTPDGKELNNHKKGCTEPLFGKKSKCLLRIVPDTFRGQTLKIHKNCLKKRG
jgi:hypothetical protein